MRFTCGIVVDAGLLLKRGSEWHVGLNTKWKTMSRIRCGIDRNKKSHGFLWVFFLNNAFSYIFFYID